MNVIAGHTIVAKVALSHFQALMMPFQCVPHMPPRPVGTHGKVNGGQKVGYGAVGGMWAFGCWPFPTLGHQSDDNLMTGRPGIQEVQRSPWHRLQTQQQETRQHAIDVVANIRF